MNLVNIPVSYLKRHFVCSRRYVVPQLSIEHFHVGLRGIVAALRSLLHTRSQDLLGAAASKQHERDTLPFGEFPKCPPLALLQEGGVNDDGIPGIE
jgi:hypothetical protein